MKIAIDATPLLVRSAGVKNYLYHWIGALRRQASPDTVQTFPRLDEFGPLNHNGSIAGRVRTLTGLGTLAIANHTPFPALDWAVRDADVYHASVLTHRPPRRPLLTATIHDMTAWTMPDLHPAANIEAERSFAELARAADGLIAVSHCTKADAVRVLGLAPEKITVIHSGVGDAFFDPPEPALAYVRAHYHIEKPFVLFVGTIEPRKNLGALFDAYSALPRSLREEHELVIAGPMGWAGQDIRDRLDTVRYLGYVPEADLGPLTAAASVFAYPSLYEGFGFPVAQAMAAGTPVVTSNVSALPEITGDAAVLIDPRSTEQLRDAMLRILLAPAIAAEMAARGRRRAEEFRWPACAARSLEFFRALRR